MVGRRSNKRAVTSDRRHTRKQPRVTRQISLPSLSESDEENEQEAIEGNEGAGEMEGAGANQGETNGQREIAQVGLEVADAGGTVSAWLSIVSPLFHIRSTSNYY